MPNWIEGSLKIRGTNGNLRKFFENAILPCADHDDKNEFIRCYFEDDNSQVDIYPNAYIDGTRRAFVSDAAILFWRTREPIITLCVPVKQAWSFQITEWLDIANKYDIDIRLYGVECGMGFWQEIEIMRLDQNKKEREVTLNTCSEYHDYDEFLWKCQMPLLGG